MDEAEKEELWQERQMIKELLDFHIKHKDRIGMSPQQFEEYVDAILDRINEIDKSLKQT